MGYKLEYIWLDGYTPEPSLRSKTKIVSEEPRDVSDCLEWSFDGSSTEQGGRFVRLFAQAGSHGSRSRSRKRVLGDDRGLGR